MAVSASTTYGIDEVNKFPDVQKKFTQGYLGVYDSISFWPSWGPTVAEAKAIDPTHPDQIYDHYAQGYKSGNQFRSSINLSGGTEKALLTSSISYSKTNGVLPNSDYKNISARLAGQFKFGNMLRLNPAVYFINSGGYRVNADRYNESLSYWSPRWNVMDYAKPDGTMESREVVVGLSDDTSYEVVSGLQEGETVVLNKNGADSKWRGGQRGGAGGMMRGLGR